MTVPGVGREETAHGSWSALAADVSALTAWLTEQGLSISAGPGAVLKALAPVLDRLTRERDAARAELLSAADQGAGRDGPSLTDCRAGHCTLAAMIRDAVVPGREPGIPDDPEALRVKVREAAEGAAGREIQRLVAERDRLVNDLDNARESAASILLDGDEIARRLIAVRAQLAERTAERDEANRQYQEMFDELANCPWKERAESAEAERDRLAEAIRQVRRIARAVWAELDDDIPDRYLVGYETILAALGDAGTEAPPSRLGRFEELLGAEHEQLDQRGELLRSVVEYQNAPSTTAGAPPPPRNYGEVVDVDLMVDQAGDASGPHAWYGGSPVSRRTPRQAGKPHVQF